MERVEKEEQGRRPAAEGPGLMMKIKKLAGWGCVLACTLLAVYIGIWRMLVRPLAGFYLAYKAGQLTVLLAVVTFIKCWLSLTVGGLIWSIGYMIKCMLD